MHQAILIIDFGSQYTQLIARRVRELNVYCEIHPFNHLPTSLDQFKGIILSGGPSSRKRQLKLDFGYVPDSYPSAAKGLPTALRERIYGSVRITDPG